MAAADPAPLWRRVVQQSVWGKRGVSKTGTLWLPIAAILSTQNGPQLSSAWLVCLLLFAASACRTQALILANDLADRIEDLAAGKDRWILRLSPAGGLAVVAALLALGVSIFLAAHAAGALAAYAAAVVLGLLYSLRPVRFKERGLMGLVVYSGSCALAYAVVPWEWLGAGWAGGGVVLAAVFLDRWVNLHFHQVIDYDADSKGARETYVVRVGLDRARLTLQWAAGLASVALVAVLMVLAARLQTAALPVMGIGVASALAAGLHARAGRASGQGSSLVLEVPWHYLGLTFALFRLLPPVLLARLALAEPTLWIPAGAAALTSLLESRLVLKYRYR